MQKETKLQLLGQVKSFAMSVRRQNQRLINKSINDIKIPADTPDYLQTFYTNLEIKLLDLLNAADMLSSSLKGYIKAEAEKDENG